MEGIHRKIDKPTANFLHLIDHDGTIFNLIYPLSTYLNHKILTSFSSSKKSLLNSLENISKEDLIVILHATGNKKFFYTLKNKLAKKFKRFYIFLHVSPKHFLLKDRLDDLNKLRRLTKKYNIKILTPSKELKKEFQNYGLNTLFIQVGIDFKLKSKPQKSTKNYKKYISTICTSEEKLYHYIKGIDKFSNLIKKLRLEKESIILGNSANLFNRIKSKKLSFNGFLKYLERSRVYLQFSRTESYNLSAIYAKRLKIPIIVSNIEGHKDNVRHGFRANNIKDAERYLKDILSKYNDPKIKNIVEKNYKDSLRRENLNSFKNSFNKLIKI